MVLNLDNFFLKHGIAGINEEFTVYVSTYLKFIFWLQHLQFLLKISLHLRGGAGIRLHLNVRLYIVVIVYYRINCELI